MKHIVCSTDNNYAPYCAVMLQSLVKTNPNLELCVHILTNDISSEYKDKISSILNSNRKGCIFHCVDETRLEGVKFRKANPLSKSAYYRILLSSLLPTIDCVLYLDVDILINGDISPLFSLDMKEYGVAACRDSLRSPICDDHRAQLNLSYSDSYFNSGVMLINLDYWRNNSVEDKLIEFSRRDRYVYFHDQDALNYVFKHKWYQMHPKYNYLNLSFYDKRMFANDKDETEYINNPVVIHFASNVHKPWYSIYFVPYRKRYLSIAYEMEISKKMLHQNPPKNILYVYSSLFLIRIINTLYSWPPLIGMLLLACPDIVLRFVSFLSFGHIHINKSLFKLRNL